jgi:hypothetical protein
MVVDLFARVGSLGEALVRVAHAAAWRGARP